MCFHYNEEREEAKENKQAVGKFKVGDRVKVKYSDYWKGDGAVTQVTPYSNYVSYIVKLDDGKIGGFEEEHLTLLPVKTGFLIGDRVRVIASRRSTYSLLPATVVGEPCERLGEIGRKIRIDGEGSAIYFFDRNLEYIPVREAVPVATPEVSVATPEAISSIAQSAYLTGLSTAIRLAKQNGTVTADQVQQEIAKFGYTSHNLGNAAGSIFRSSRFRKVGEVKSTRPGNRGRKIAQWELVNA